MDRIQLNELLVLLVEPSGTQLRIISGHLTEIGVMNIHAATTGGDALAKLDMDRYDLVISTMHLADMTGTDLIQKLREAEDTADIPFMLISSETHYRYLEPLRQAGVIAILPKPYAIEQLRRALWSTVHYLDPGSLDTKDIEQEDLNVLVVDDSLTSRKYITRVLRNMGIEKITEAKNGKEAVDFLDAHFYDLVVTDYNMPEMDGKELLEHIRHHSDQASVPVLMVSSESDQNRLAAVQQAGVSAICDKPFESDAVKQLLEKMLA